MRESQIQSAILEYLAARHILAFRMQTGAVKLDKRFVRFGVPGMADVLAFPLIKRPRWTGTYMTGATAAVEPLWIECKAGKGTQSSLQKSFQQQVECEGHRYIIARSVDDVEAALG